LLKLPFIVRYQVKYPLVYLSLYAIACGLSSYLLSFAELSIPRKMIGMDQKEAWLGQKEKVTAKNFGGK